MRHSPLPASTGASHGGERPLPLSRGRIVDILTDTLGDLQGLSLALQGPDPRATDAARRLRDGLMSQVGDHILPRLADADVPAVVVVGGSTGAGKSTLVNSVLGREVSEAGVLRPTTRTPVLVTNPEDAQALEDHPVSQVCHTVVDDSVPPGLAMVDASDLDSVQESNRSLALRLLEAADLWLFITTAARYGDLTPWTTLERAAQRGTPVAVVLNRAPRQVLAEVRRDLVERLAGLGLAEAPFFVIPDAGPHQGPLTGPAVEDLSAWLALLAGRHRAAGLTRRGERRVWDGLTRDLVSLADAVDAQEQAAQDLENRLQEEVTQAQEHLRDLLAAGPAASGAVATRWVSLASSGGALQDLAQGRALRRGWLGRRGRAREEGVALLSQDADAAVTVVCDGVLASLRAELTRIWTEAAQAPVPATLGAEGSGSPAGGVPGVPSGPSDAPASQSGAAPRHDTTATQTCAGDHSEPGSQLREGPQCAWRRQVTDTVASVTVKGLSSTAVADLVAAAACGLDGAAHACQRLGLGEQVNQARQALTGQWQHAAAVVLTRGTALALAPNPAVAASLRLRAAELTPLTTLGGEKTA